jgi:histidinol-phosphate aminotransferase
LADIQGANWEQVPFNDPWELPQSFGENREDLKLVLLPNPNSPSGTIVSKRQIAELSNSLNCPLVIDEAYADFAEENCLDLVQSNENIFVTRTLSKSYGLAGIRFGFLVAQPHVIAELTKIKDSYNCDAISIAAATAAMGCQDWLGDVVAKMNVTRQRMTERLQALGFDVTPSHANFVWCRHPEGKHAEIHQYLKQSQILIRYMDFPDWGDGMRISVGTDEQIDACMLMLERAMQSLNISLPARADST